MAMANDLLVLDHFCGEDPQRQFQVVNIPSFISLLGMLCTMK